MIVKMNLLKSTKLKAMYEIIMVSLAIVVVILLLFDLSYNLPENFLLYL